MYSTPLRTDPAERVVDGLCTSWNASADFRTWTFRCSHAYAIAAELKRVARLPASPARWMFANAQRISVHGGSQLVVALRLAWRRFPYALTTVAAAPRDVTGPFRLVDGSPNRVVLRRNGTTLVFERHSAVVAERGFLRGRFDEAPVALGDLGLFRGMRRVLHVRPLLALDAVVFRGASVPSRIRHAYGQTADRTDYEALVMEGSAGAAFGLLGGAGEQPDLAAFRRAMHSIPSLPPQPVRIAVADDPVLQYGARILYAQWRELGLGPVLVGQNAAADASLFRARAAYPQTEALLGAFGLQTALGETQQRLAFSRVDASVQTNAVVVPVCWVADARLVSPRLHGWREDVLGDVDYTAVTP